MHGESASVGITSENIQNELRKIEELLGPCDPVDVMNFDETGLYYQQPPRRTICSESLDGLKKKIFTAYVKKLNVAFGRQNRKIALLLDNASVHKELLTTLRHTSEPSNTIVLYVCISTMHGLNTTNNEEMAEGNIDETEENDNTEQDEQRVDIVEFPLDDLDRKLHRRIRMRLADSCAELNKSKEQTNLRSYFTKGSCILRDAKSRIYGAPKHYKLYKSKEALKQEQAEVEEAVNSDKKEDFILENDSQIVEFLNYIYRPSEEALFDSRYKPALVSDKDILSTVWKFTTKFDKKSPLSFSQWLSHQKLDLIAVEPQRKNLKTGSEIRIRKRQLNVLNDKYLRGICGRKRA
ncbi:hypothetical protein G6F46_008771 [Rhizopus delemar]|uniref:DDE-1 domain-containing protein n=2 Tax=Rhizopus TaxID=4842 RepID=A0A9P6YHP5_RHIOR|nr:hypothetical protein G6F51_003680 [Rhizopus arrhizus]KAG1612070.1 hypothetical protein G6F46_008771 [Rhizopus delemar]